MNDGGVDVVGIVLDEGDFVGEGCRGYGYGNFYWSGQIGFEFLLFIVDLVVGNCYIQLILMVYVGFFLWKFLVIFSVLFVVLRLVVLLRLLGVWV